MKNLSDNTPSSVVKKSYGRTKEKILENSLMLFNDQGFDSVTTASIAKHSSVLEGTLWYHFNTKLDLAVAHQDIFIETFQNHIGKYGDESPVEVINYFIEGIKIFWDFRYLFRDISKKIHSEENKRISSKVKESMVLFEETLKQGVLSAVAGGTLVLSEPDIEDFTISLLILGRYWLDYASIRHPDKDEEFYRKRNIELLLKFVTPYLSSDVKEALNQEFK